MLMNTDIEKRIGAMLRARRRAAGLTQEELGQKVDLSYQQIQKYETGANRVAVSTLIRLADALGTTPATLLSEIERE